MNMRTITFNELRKIKVIKYNHSGGQVTVTADRKEKHVYLSAPAVLYIHKVDDIELATFWQFP